MDGLCTSPDGSEQAQVLLKAGKAHKGYFTNDNIIKHSATAMVILKKGYPDKEHVLVFDNTTTHLKREEDALSATKIPKFTPKLGMTNVKFTDGTTQSLY
jgi:hypothetical protein